MTNLCPNNRPGVHDLCPFEQQIKDITDLIEDWVKTHCPSKSRESLPEEVRQVCHLAGSVVEMTRRMETMIDDTQAIKERDELRKENRRLKIMLNRVKSPDLPTALEILGNCILLLIENQQLIRASERDGD